MRSHHKGQVSAEYVMVTIIIILGVLITGPYLIRSINGFFKVIDESVEDSFREELVPPTDSRPLPACTCSPFRATIFCGDGLDHNQDGILDNCEVGQRILFRQCIPGGCNWQLCADGNTSFCQMTECSGDPQCSGIIGLPAGFPALRTGQSFAPPAP